MNVEQIEPYMLAALQRYADFDRSDPFTFARGLAHIRQGLCGACVAADMDWSWRDSARGKNTRIKLGSEIGSMGHYDARGTGNASRL